MGQPKFNGRRLVVALCDFAVVVLAFVFAFLLRFDFQLDAPGMDMLWPTVLPVGAVYLLAFRACALYRGIYYFSSFADLLNITKAVGAAAFAAAFGVMFVRQGQFPRSVLLMHPILAFLGVGGIRFGIRLIKTWLNMPRVYTGSEKNLLLVGAGELGESLLRQINKTPELNCRVVGFLDDDSAKWGLRIHGVPVFGGVRSLAAVLKHRQVDEIVITVASKRGELVRSVMEELRELKTRPELKTVPSLDELLRGARQDMRLRKVKPADLLNRDVVRLDMARIGKCLQAKTILVTGAGGTIGSELCRQVLQYKPARLVILEAHATSLFYIEGELRRLASCEIVPLLGDIRDQALIDKLFNEHKPHVILHAAAHKHVHQLEVNVAEGIGNNVLGTYYLAKAARDHGAESFVLVSTDKAVRPASVMGATKRVAEMIVRGMSAGRGTRFVAVRFGNVLGSSGSVLEIFQQQIAAGGPITVTHPDVTRYFMTVQESVQLILQASAMARGGEIFVLKMGTPVRILDMAKNLLLLSGLEPEKDMEIQITGLKPGEKMDEELIEDPGSCVDSEHPSIMVLRDGAAREMDETILDLEIAVRNGTPATLARRLRELVPTYTPSALHLADPA